MGQQKLPSHQLVCRLPACLQYNPVRLDVAVEHTPAKVGGRRWDTASIMEGGRQAGALAARGVVASPLDLASN